MKLALGLSIALVVAALGCSRKPKNLKEEVSYSIGAQFGRSLKAQGLDLDTKALSNGIVDGYKGEKLELNEEQMQKVMMKLAENRQADLRVEAEKNLRKANEFLEKNKEETGVKTTATGLQYKVEAEGSGPQPKDTDVVVVNFTGRTADGGEFDSTSKRGRPAEFPIKGVVPGWTEGLLMMKKGAKYTFYVPPNLGYGERPRQKMPPNSVLIFETELVDFKPMPAGGKGASGPGHPVQSGKPAPRSIKK